MQAAIGYLRVSTREQGRSGLGLAAQRFEIEQFGAREGFHFTEDLKKITVPTFVMHGDDDQIVPYPDSAPLTAKLVKTRL